VKTVDNDDCHDDECNDDDDDADNDGSLSEDVASLLRGPIMAARSVMTASSPHSGGGEGGGVTPQETSPLSTTQQQQQQQQPISFVVETPHTTRGTIPIIATA
jgi:hypothetical protein